MSAILIYHIIVLSCSMWCFVLAMALKTRLRQSESFERWLEPKERQATENYEVDIKNAIGYTVVIGTALLLATFLL